MTTYIAIIVACSVLLPGVICIEPYPTQRATARPVEDEKLPERPERPSLFDRLFPSFPHSSVVEVPFSGFGQRWQAVEMMMRYLDGQMNDMLRDLGSLIPIDREREEWCVSHPVITEANGTRIFRVTLDMRQFKPEEISIKVRDNFLHVNGKQESKSEFTNVFRMYSRQFALPEGVQVEALRSSLSPEGVLVITAPLAEAEESEEVEEESEPTTAIPVLPELPPELLPESEREKKEETINIIHE